RKALREARRNAFCRGIFAVSAARASNSAIAEFEGKRSCVGFACISLLTRLSQELVSWYLPESIHKTFPVRIPVIRVALILAPNCCKRSSSLPKKWTNICGRMQYSNSQEKEL